jgi:DNA-binding MurR/RpiR family transcriptional regulator
MPQKQLQNDIPRVYQRLSEKLAALSSRRQGIIGPVLQNPGELVLLSVRGLAEWAGTNPATLLRTIRALGFPSYKAFQHYLHELSGFQATSLDKVRAGYKAATGSPGLVEASLDCHHRNLAALINNFDPARAIALAKRICNAGKILLLGGDMASAAVLYMEYQLTVVGLPVLVSTTPGRTFHVARSVGPRDLVIAVSFGRGLRQTVEGLQSARERGAYTVGVTDSFLSPLARFGHECFITPADTVAFAPSHMTLIALIDTISAAIAGLKRTKILSLLDQVDEEQRQGHRWYRSEPNN